MKIILDTDKKTITVPYNYTEKLAVISRIARDFGGTNVEALTFTGYIDRIWRECIADPDTHIVTAPKPVRSKAPRG
ncbi:MAG: hypothetical protein IKS31_05125 [Clostridia bacterium]|nr:hypothetical protein [Clostridia bacterium]MBR4458322.1 hypothetical protein [Clostridia bacterium]